MARLITLRISASDLELLTTLASDQLFRKEFIDHRVPGSRTNSADIQQAKALIARLRLAQERGVNGRPTTVRSAG